MKVTAAEFKRKSSQLLARVQRGETLFLEKRGRLVAVVSPSARPGKRGSFSKLLAGLKPDPETADAIEKCIRMMDEAEKRGRG